MKALRVYLAKLTIVHFPACFFLNRSVLKGGRRVQSIEVPTVKLNKAWKGMAHMAGISATISVTRANKNGSFTCTEISEL